MRINDDAEALGLPKKCLAPTLEDFIVVGSFHSEARGAELRYLPEYSPDLNPIKSVFHPPKALLRKAAERTVSGLAMRSLLHSRTQTFRRPGLFQALWL